MLTQCSIIPASDLLPAFNAHAPPSHLHAARLALNRLSLFLNGSSLLTALTHTTVANLPPERRLIHRDHEFASLPSPCPPPNILHTAALNLPSSNIHILQQNAIPSDPTSPSPLLTDNTWQNLTPLARSHINRIFDRNPYPAPLDTPPPSPRILLRQAHDQPRRIWKLKEAFNTIILHFDLLDPVEIGGSMSDPK
jgi:hypothetical protein